MVLFLFVVMMIGVESPGEVMFPLSQWLPAAFFGLVYLAAAIAMIFAQTRHAGVLTALMATPRQFALFVFEQHWFSIEVVSILLLLALIGALQLERAGSEGSRKAAKRGDRRGPTAPP